MELYISGGMTSTRIFPSCVGMLVSDVQEFCKQLGIKVQLFHASATPAPAPQSSSWFRRAPDVVPDKPLAADHVCETCLVKEQKPLAGTLFDMHKPLVVQLIVGEHA
jgi:hypothetical protein